MKGTEKEKNTSKQKQLWHYTATLSSLINNSPHLSMVKEKIVNNRVIAPTEGLYLTVVVGTEEHL